MTPKEREAIQQALEALEELHYSSGTVVAARKYELATAALREALAERKVLTMTQEEIVDAIRSARIEQAEQEPMGYHVTAGRRISDGMQVVFGKDEILYAAPVRTKDLTDDEIYKLVKQVRFDGMTDRTFQFARAVIAAYKEKNK